MLKERPFRFVLSGDLRLLAIDDDPIQLEFCSVYLSAPGVTVVGAPDAAAGLARLEAERVDALLVDVEMPGMSGIELVRRLRSDRRYDDLPIMVVTGREDMASIDDAFEAGATSFLCKPVNWRLLAHHVRYMIRAHRSLSTGDRGRVPA
jgi:DNA-binding response OmpR family regulator